MRLLFPLSAASSALREIICFLGSIPCNPEGSRRGAERAERTTKNEGSRTVARFTAR